jgi:uncharacterized protein
MWRWILNAIVILLLLRLALRFVLGLFQGLAEPTQGDATRGTRGPSRAKAVSALVQDPVCGTYVPRETAIAVNAGGGTRFYCSEACRDKDRFASSTLKGRAAHG